MPFWSIDHTEMEAAQERPVGPVAEVLVRFLLIFVLFADYHTDS